MTKGVRGQLAVTCTAGSDARGWTGVGPTTAWVTVPALARTDTRTSSLWAFTSAKRGGICPWGFHKWKSTGTVCGIF